MTRLLVIDWDYFFPTHENDPEQWHLYDWQHSEEHSPELQEVIWNTRAMGFAILGKELPLTSGDEDNFWQRFTIAPDAELFYGDSNVLAVEQQVYSPFIDDVWLFDAHHDCGYQGRTIEEAQRLGVSCEDWMFQYDLSGAELHVRYPSWRNPLTDGSPTLRNVDISVDVPHLPVPGSFDRIFVCRSGAWTPTWVEDAFWKFIDAAPVANRIPLRGITRREYSPEAVAELVGQHQQVRALIENSGGTS